MTDAFKSNCVQLRENVTESVNFDRRWRVGHGKATFVWNSTTKKPPSCRLKALLLFFSSLITVINSICILKSNNCYLISSQLQWQSFSCFLVRHSSSIAHWSTRIKIKSSKCHSNHSNCIQLHSTQIIQMTKLNSITITKI